jgi:hypothetical protein
VEAVVVVGAAVMVEEEVAVTHLSVVDTHLPDPPAVALVRGLAGCQGFLLVDFLVAEITAALVTVVSMDAIATFTVVASTILISAFSLSVSRALDIQMITTNTPTHIGITTMMRI